ncbi:MAG: PEP-CTERM sorting domain-containing protein [Candidatus Omnitrophica bacterium]|nr:PEP-CTERM sorting domain-containing protein [Candidatus Omnitrophota bacterium]
MIRKPGIIFISLVFLCVCLSASWGTPLKEDYAAYMINFAQGTPTTSGVHDTMDTYTVSGMDCWARLKPMDVGYRRAVSQNFFDVLTAAFPVANGWSYASAINELSDDSLVVHTYDVQGTAARVGAEFHLEYIPHGDDPTTNLHWIQVVTTNHSLRNPPGSGHGTNFNGVDNPFSTGGRSPYYDDGGAATANHFYDFPGRSDTAKAHTWMAELFLVSGPAADAGPGLITFYGGVTWGWENDCVPEPATMTLVAAGASALLYKRRKRIV